jgi:hypothetical protein
MFAGFLRDSARWADNSSSIIGLRIYDRHNWRHYVPLMNEKCLAGAEIGIHILLEAQKGKQT